MATCGVGVVEVPGGAPEGSGANDLYGYELPFSVAGFYLSVLTPCIEMIWFAHVNRCYCIRELIAPSSPRSRLGNPQLKMGEPVLERSA
jgi:hypothetical protein